MGTPGSITEMHAQSRTVVDTTASDASDASDESDAMPIATFSPAELAALPPVVGQILREITQALASLDDEMHL